MQIYTGIENFVPIRKAVVTSGTFDGVHIGHQKILRRLRETADASGGETALITYWPHPRMVLYPEQNDLKLLSTLEEKQNLLERFGIDHLLIVKFDKSFSSLTSMQFVQEIVAGKIQTQKLVIGYDHKFGRNREGGFDFLKENAPFLGFEVEEIPRQEVDEIGVSSTKIRAALSNGEIQTANSYLGHLYSVQGEVVKGKQIGRSIGFPTANIHIKEPEKLIPQDGIYAVWAWAGGKKYGAAMSIGLRPTIGDNLARTLEAYLFGFNGDLYGQEIKIEFVAYLRGEEKYASLELLKEQIEKDKAKAMEMLYGETGF